MLVLIISLPMVLAEEYNRLYDANGNLVYDSQDDIYREYNELNQLVRTRQNNATGIILQEYIFDPIKERIFIKDEFYTNGSLKSSTYYFGMDYIVIQNSSGTFNRTNIYQDGILVGYEDFDGRKRYILSDHEGSAHIVLNESGDVIEENLFSPFAEPLQGVIENKFSYEAKEYDSLVKDYDFHFRKYDPKLRIFTQPDTLIQNVYDPQLLNRYAFERNSPYKYTDPDGHVLPGIVVFIVIVGAISSVLIWYNIIAKGGKHPAMGPDVSNDPLYQKYTQELIEGKEKPIQTQTQEPKEEFPQVPTTRDGTYVPPEAIEEQKRLGKEICELANIDCGEDSRLKLKIDPTIEDRYISKMPEEKKEEPKSTGGPSGSSPGSGPYGCSWWEECIVNYDSLG